MDLGLYARVLKRFKFLVAGGFVAALLLAVLATASISFAGGLPKLTYRKPALWQSQASLLLTQQRFPWGRADANPQQFANLVGLYAKLVNSDAVQARLDLKRYQTLRAVPGLDTSIFGSSTPLPILSILGAASTPSQARLVANRGANVFRRYIDENQSAAAIPWNQRIVLKVINQASQAELLEGHKKTVPMLVFITVMIATLGLAFILENLRPSMHVVPASGRAREFLQKSA